MTFAPRRSASKIMKRYEEMKSSNPYDAQDWVKSSITIALQNAWRAGYRLGKSTEPAPAGYEYESVTKRNRLKKEAK